MNTAKLLIFAHRGEAQAFFNEWDFLPVTFHFTGLFKNNDHYLLITGEGPKEASEKTVATLAVFKSEISQVFNIGIAGSLTPKLKVHDLVWVRSSYAQNAERCEFKSFTTKHHNNIDCMTVNTRVTTLEEKKNLSNFADIVDRELWSIASAAHLFKIDFLALKLISDDLSSTDICQLVKEEAPALSKKLFAEYQRLLKDQETKVPLELHAPKSNKLEDFILLHPKLYFTTSQARKLNTVLKGLSLKKTLTDEEVKSLIADLVDQQAEDKTSKELSKILLTVLSERLNPLNTQIKNKIMTSVAPLTDAGAQVNFDPELEQEFVQINFQIRSNKDQKKLMLALEQFNYQKIKDIFSGNLGDDV
jgi:hypothetical protein